MSTKKFTIGISGAAGFIGSHLTSALVKKGYKVIGIDNFSKGNKKNLNESKSYNNFQFYKFDIQDKKRLAKAFSSCTTIVHLAASKIPRYGDRLTTLKVNTLGTENVLEIARINSAKVVFISTSDVYGKNDQLPFVENSDLVLGSSEVARWAYAASKIFDEHLCFAYSEQYDLPVVILRLFGVYGPHQHRSWWGGPQSLFIDAILNNRAIEIHGTGKQTRTFIYVDDVTEAIIRAIESKKANGHIINVGSNREISINDLAKLTAKLIGKQLKIKKVKYESFTGKKYEDVMHRVPSIEKAQRILGWSPKIPLEAGLLKTIEWHRRNQ